MTDTQTVALDERLVDATIGALELYSIHLGRHLGLYEALMQPRTASDLSTTTGIAERYAREWLEQQAVADLIAVDDPSLPWNRRRYRLTPEQRAAFTDPDHPANVSALADMVAGVGTVIASVADAYRSGHGVPYADYGPRFRSGQGGINRPAATHDLAGSWLRDLPSVVGRLEEGGRIADLGCGTGWSTIALARAFPNSEVVGYDLDEASISDAENNAREAAVPAVFYRADAATAAAGGPYDLVVMIEALHDMADPVGVLRSAHHGLAADGVLLLADEKVAERFEAPGDQLERMMYGWSVLHCLPASLAEENSAALGTVMRPNMVRLMASEAGFGSVEQSGADAGFFNLYVLRP